MKNALKIGALMLIMGLSTYDSQAQIIVRVRPPRPRVVAPRPPMPGPGRVWVEEDWRPRGRTYEWHGGYWTAPPRAGARWIPGHWARRRGGEVWIGGHWRY